jgi:predicted PurR-regulated permease PerM
MLTVTGLFIVCILISFLSFALTSTYRKGERAGNAIAGLIVPSVISSIIVAIIIGISYTNYIGLKQYNVTIQQYANSINLYSKLTVPNKNVTQSLEITDLKYQNYQTSIKELIQELRRRVVNYNKTLIGKRELGNNIVFSWLIIMPDKNMKTLKMEDFISVK